MKMMRLPRLYKIAVRFPKTVLLLTAVVTVVSFHGASRLRIESDLTALLPKKTESVQALDRLKELFGGSSYLFLTVESNDNGLSERFADDFVTRLEGHPDVLYVDFRHPVDYFKKRFWLYLDLKDLHEMEHRVDRALALEKEGVSSTFSDMMVFSDPEERPNLNFDDIFQKYKKRAGTAREGFTSDEGGQFLVIRVKTKEGSEDIDASRRFIGEVKKIEAEVKRTPAYGEVTVGYTGGYQTKIEQVELIQKEIAWVSGIVALALFLILLFYFRSVSGAILVSIPLAVSLVVTGGLVYLLLGHLNIITGFAAAILAGLGSDYGIYLLTRYYQERGAGTDFLTSCDRAFSFTGKATWGSMATTVGSFVALLLSSFGVFIEFGVVGALGILATYTAMMLVLPACLALNKSHHWKPKKPKKEGKFVQSPLFEAIFAPRRAVQGVVLTLFLCILAAITLPSQTKIYFESGQMDNRNLPGNKLYDRVSHIINATLDPTILVVKGDAEEERVLRHLESLLKKEDHSEPLIYNEVLGLSSFIPEEPGAKRAILKRLKNKIEALHLMIKDYRKMLLGSLQDSLEAPPVNRNNLPMEVRRIFVSPVEKDVYTIYFYPTGVRQQPGGMDRYRRELNDWKAELKIPFVVADGDFVVDDTVKLIQQEAPRGMIFILLFLFIVLLAIIRPVGRAAIIMAHLAAGLVLLSGLLWLIGVSLNILNISAISIVLGTGIDSFIHFNQRYDESGNLLETIRNKVPAIGVANLTSIVGLGGLLFTSSSGIRSVGWVAVLGLMIVTLLAVFIFPRCLTLMPSRKYGYS